MIETRYKQILDYLTKDYEFHSSYEIGKVLKLSSKTVQNLIRNLNSIINDKGAVVESESGKGYRFVIKDNEKFSRFLRNDWYKVAYFQVESGDKYARIENILKLLLFSNSYIKQGELAEIFYVSNSQINKDIKEIKKTLSHYKLKLVSKPYYGMKIEGSEQSLRQAIKNEIGEDPDIFSGNEDKKLFQEIQDIISTMDFGSSYTMPYVAFKNLVIHIYISILRIKQGKYVTTSTEMGKKVVSYEEFDIANKIVKRLQEKLEIDIPYQELVYLTMHLIAKNTITDQEKLSPKILELSKEIIDKIYQVSRYDFRSNIDLYFSLSMHLGPLVKRINYGFNMKNPILSDIKKNKVAFLLATIGANVINNRYNTHISEDEIGYLALHIMAAMNESDTRSRNILIVCGSGNSSARIMKAQLEKNFMDRSNNILTTDIRDLDKYDLEKFDFLISSVNLVNLNIKTKTPIIYADIIFNDRDLKKISRAYDKNGLDTIAEIFQNSVFIKNPKVINKDEVLDLLSQKASEKSGLKEEYIKSQILEREKLGKIAYDNGIVLPHILEAVTGKSFLIIISMNKPVIWQGEKTSLVFSFFVGENIGNMSLFYRKLGDFLSDDKSSLKISRLKNIEEVREAFIGE